jgi:hypothetical protein
MKQKKKEKLFKNKKEIIYEQSVYIFVYKYKCTAQIAKHHNNHNKEKYISERIIRNINKNDLFVQYVTTEILQSLNKLNFHSSCFLS